MWNVFVIPDTKTGAPAFIACVSTDITERRKVEDALRRSEKLFRELADSMPQMIWAAQPDGHVDYYNKRWYEYTGFPERYGNESWTPVLHPDDVERTMQTYSDCIRDERIYQIEYRLKDRRDRRLPVVPRTRAAHSRRVRESHSLVRHLHRHRRSKTRGGKVGKQWSPSARRNCATPLRNWKHFPTASRTTCGRRCAR